jgi:hypothetical protein
MEKLSIKTPALEPFHGKHTASVRNHLRSFISSSLSLDSMDTSTSMKITLNTITPVKGSPTTSTLLKRRKITQDCTLDC